MRITDVLIRQYIALVGHISVMKVSTQDEGCERGNSLKLLLCSCESDSLSWRHLNFKARPNLGIHECCGRGNSLELLVYGCECDSQSWRCLD
ncbi:hypothetical protein J6590_008629 [Homalodisca vitripennis]|nr:hypothetical protein J6590_008629 [Homalodisca vitripennis]